MNITAYNALTGDATSDTAVVSFLKVGYRDAAAELIDGGFCILPQD